MSTEVLDYRPTDDEPFMNEKHRAYFRKRLLDWKDEILRQTRETLAILHEDFFAETIVDAEYTVKGYGAN